MSKVALLLSFEKSLEPLFPFGLKGGMAPGALEQLENGNRVVVVLTASDSIGGDSVFDGLESKDGKAKALN